MDPLLDIITRHGWDDDAHPAMRDRFLTNGARSIPILVALDDEDCKPFRRGPRPAAAPRVVEAALPGAPGGGAP